MPLLWVDGNEPDDGIEFEQSEDKVVRLTLRTLLAYLDDTLEPAATKEIGQKLTESRQAQELVSRIREVTRRRRVTAPPVAGDDLDPDLLAEYLDNLLPADAVARVENLCLDSDVHLAEAAACHQILTMIGQPANVSTETRQRMYDLVHSIESMSADRHAAAHVDRHPAPAPWALSERPLLARILTRAAIVLGVVGACALVWISLNVNRAKKEQNDTGPVAATGLNVEPGKLFIPERVGDERYDPALPKLPPAESVDLQLKELETALAKSGEQSAPPKSAAGEASKPEQQMPKTEDAPKPEATKVESATTEPKPKEPVKSEPAEPAQPKPPTIEPAVVLGKFVSTSGVLLRADPTSAEWRRLAAQTDIKNDERFLCLPAFRAALQLAKGPSAELVGETELSLEPAKEGVDAHIKLDHGRLVLGTNNARAVIRVDFVDQSWSVTVKGPEQSVGLSVMPVWQPGGPVSYEATLYVPRGEVEFQSATQAHHLGGPVQLRWSTTGGMRDKESLGLPPAWMEKEVMTPVEVRAASALEAAIPFDGSVVLALVDATREDRRESRVLAVQSLGAIERLPALIDAMNTMDRREVRKAAIAALRQYLARKSEHEEAVLNALLVRFNKSEVHANGVLDLLRGYSDEEFQKMKAKNYRSLIDLLGADHDLCIRELAIMNLEDLAGKPSSINYSPDKPRDTDIQSWNRAVDEGRLPPKTRGKM